MSVRFVKYAPHPIALGPIDPKQLVTLETIVVEPDPEVFRAMRRGQMDLERENICGERWLLGSESYLTLIACLYEREPWRYPIKTSGDQIIVFDLPVSLDPSKPGKWVQCLPETNIRNATYQQLPPNIGVGRGLVATDAVGIRDMVEEVTERRIILPNEACAEIAKVAIVTSYWESKYPRKPEREWTGVERKELR